jgi:Arc/MetJ-type ribon-helix-helix transcriptional regulator
METFMGAGQVHVSASARRRRSLPDDPLKKFTVQLSGSVIEAIRNVVEHGEAPSANYFVEEALRDKLRERRRAKVYAAYEEAAHDPAYVADADADLEAFDATLKDGLK